MTQQTSKPAAPAGQCEELHIYGSYAALERSARYRRSAVLGELIAGGVIKALELLGRPRVRRSTRQAYS